MAMSVMMGCRKNEITQQRRNSTKAIASSDAKNGAFFFILGVDLRDVRIFS
jgi:hypothetical protein